MWVYHDKKENQQCRPNAWMAQGGRPALERIVLRMQEDLFLLWVCKH
jgi:hypothetical protein